ncbi:hypothetical protein BOTBODRAFT_60011 [Botryobasidium botryosum FD-172 SS1]|uniref:Uncharacterized protein n=1 Tax=Botryobasidium botryosum (strain FD-172 SS1) TaxID=930990 RepID=A0A067M6E1_BOTB1|nr:hypothetical protein BOTBODRAFT_60011 [Botryobasidium botryosum FD-172 SS1]
MPVTFEVTKDKAKSAVASTRHMSDVQDFVKTFFPTHGHRCAEILQSSLTQEDLDSLEPKVKGFVGTVLAAYNMGHHLTIRPDDVWIAIVTQLTLFVNAHSGELEKQFVAHAGKKKLAVERESTSETADRGLLTQECINHLRSNLVDKELSQWILPDFTTTSLSDNTICAITLTSTLESFSSYPVLPSGNIPSVTLEGEKSDWESILARLSKLKDFGSEPAAWANMLRPILKRFISAFNGESDIDFWSKVAHASPGASGPSHLSGWLSAFCAWTMDGKWQGSPGALDASPQQHQHQHQHPEPDFQTMHEVSTSSKRAKKRASFSMRLITSAVGFFTGRGRNGNVYVPYGHDSPSRPPLVLDGITYPTIDDITNAYCEVDVTVRDSNGEELECVMVAGHLASRVVDGPGEGEKEGGLKPLPRWFLYCKVLDPVAPVVDGAVGHEA